MAEVSKICMCTQWMDIKSIDAVIDYLFHCGIFIFFFLRIGQCPAPNL